MMKYRLIRNVLNKSDVAFYNRTGKGLKATQDVLEVDYSENGQQGLCIRYVVYVGDPHTLPSQFVRDLGEYYEVVTNYSVDRVAKKDVDIIERAPL